MLKKIGNNIKKSKDIYLTFLIGIAIISIIYFLQKISPFGENSTLTVDFYHQYGPMLAELYNRISTGKNLIYSFTMSMGLPFFRNFLNYLSSPFNILLLLFKHENLLTGFSIIIGLKAVAASTTMSYFLKKKFNSKTPVIIALGLLYGFNAYFTAYYWNIMWLDGLVFLPLITKGIEDLIDEDKNLLYILSLATMIIANYFIAYMICIYSVIYFAIYLFINKKNLKYKKIIKKIFVFCLSSLLAGTLTAVLTLPLASSLTSTSATNDTMPFTRYYEFNLLEFLISHLSGSTKSVFASDITNAPNISCGIICLALLILFYTNPKIHIKIKIAYSIILGILIASFFYAPLDYIWHAFHVPNDLPYRFSFLYSFTLLIICSYSLLKIKDNKIIFVFISYLLCLGFLIFVKILDTEQITNNLLLINIILISIYFLIYTIHHFYPKVQKLMYIIFILTISLECIIKTNSNWSIDQKISDFYDDYNQTQNILNFIKDNNSDNNESIFYRVEKTNMLTFNDSSWYNYYGITSFSSMIYENLAKMQRDLGMPGNEINSFYYKPNTPIYNLMFNLKYTLGDNHDYLHYKNILINNKEPIYKTNFYNNLFYVSNHNIKNWKLTEKDPIRNQNNFIEYTTGIKNTFEKKSVENKNIIEQKNNITLIKYEFANSFTNNYIYLSDNNIDFFIINNVLYTTNDNQENLNIIFPQLSYYNTVDYTEKRLLTFYSDDENIEVYIGYNYYHNNDITLYNLNESKFSDAVAKLSDTKINIIKFAESNIVLTTNLKKDETIYSSIPYDKGWEVYVDSKKIETYKIADTLLGFDIKQGNHTIELKYKPHGYKYGLIITLTSTIILFISQWKWKRKLQ